MLNGHAMQVAAGILAFGLLAVAACGSIETSGVCEQDRVCQCANGQTGVEICPDDAPGRCVCDARDAGLDRDADSAGGDAAQDTDLTGDTDDSPDSGEDEPDAGDAAVRHDADAVSGDADSTDGSADVSDETDDAGADTPLDRDAPQVTAVLPLADARDVALGPTISAQFDEPLQLASLTRASVILESGDASVDYAVEYDPPTRTVRLSLQRELALLTTFSVRLTSDVSDLAGNQLATPFVWSFTTRDGVWTEPQSLGSGGGPHVALNESGVGMITWDGVQTARVSVAGPVVPTGELDINGMSATSSDTAVDAAGNALVVFSQVTADGRRIYADRHALTTGWDGPDPLGATAEPANSPSVAVNASGAAVAAWLEGEFDAPSLVWAALFEPGSGWGDATLLNGGEDAFNSPVVAIDDDGNAFVAWNQDDAIANREAVARRYDAEDETWGEIDLISRPEATSVPVLAVQPTTQAVVALLEANTPEEGGDSILTNAYQPDVGWLGPDDRDGTGEDNFSAWLDFDPQGGAWAVWVSNDTDLDTWGIRAAHLTTDGWMPHEDILSLSDDYEVEAPSVVAAPGGNALAVWDDDENTIVYWSRYHAGSWSTPEPLSAELAGASNAYRAIASDAQGRVLLVWRVGSTLELLRFR